MPHPSRKLTRPPLSLTLLTALVLTACASSPQPRADADKADNFGFPLGFSVSKMDLSADPRKDFNRFAAGRWLDAAVIPGDNVRTSGIDAMARKIERDVASVVRDAAAASATAPKGSPTQQVGDFYRAGLDETRLAALGTRPLQSLLGQIDASTADRSAAARMLARFAILHNEPVVVGATVDTDQQDRSKYVVYFADAALGMGVSNYLSPQAQPIRDAYRKMIVDELVLAGRSPEQAATAADVVLRWETRIAAAKLTPVQAQDPAQRFRKMNFAALQALLPSMDLAAYFRVLGLPTEGEVTVVESAALKVRNDILAQATPGELQDYLRWELVRRNAPYLGPAFVEPGMTFTRAQFGAMDTPPPEKRVAGMVPTLLGHPVSQLYVARYLAPETKRAAEDLVGRVRAEYRRRLVANPWMTPATHEQALAKLDKVDIAVGYPSTWIDYSGVDIRADDFLGNVHRINAFMARRNLALLGQPVVIDRFNVPGQTLPVDANAAYSPENNSIEIPAAFLQPPFYDVNADDAVNYCSLGAVIGHELTHGFDQQGRLFDARGALRNWWAPADEKRFMTEADKLVRQANAFEAVPGLKLNGQLAVGENLADTGGIALAYGALKRYLAEHPGRNRPVDGLSQDQRCFLSWSQAWADKAREGWLRQILAVDPHPTGIYRMTAPLKHEDGFYRAFGIQAGDPMWLAPADRIRLW